MQNIYQELEEVIKDSYESGVTIEEAERLAGRFLHAQIQVANDLMEADLDARMKKSGAKAIKAAVYMEAATKSDKKPSDGFLQNVVDMDKIVQQEQSALDTAEVRRNALENYLSIFREAHIHFRSIAKGRFE